MEHGHKAHHEHGHGEGGHMEDFKRRLVVTALLSIPLILLTPWIRSYLFPHMGVSYLYSLTTTALMLMVYFYGGYPFLKGMLRELERLKPGMMTLVSMGITSATVYGLYEFAAGREPTMAFEMALLVVVMLAGHWAEMKYSLSASKALTELASLIPSVAHLLTDKGEVDVPSSELRPGDIVVIRPGERVPADSEVVGGSALVDESLLTGESKPVSKGPGSALVGGSLLINGSLTARVQRTGEEMFLSQVIRLVREAKETKTHVQTLADKGATFLTFAALGIGLASLAYWVSFDTAFAVERMVTVLVASCPHALGIGVPLAAIVVSLRGAKKGILVRNRRAFENAAKANVVVFDKTGTLTTGRLKVKEVVSFGDYSQDDVLFITASVEKAAEHPIARAIVDFAKNKGVEPEDPEVFEVISGIGVRGVVDGREVYVGGPTLLKSLGIKVDDDRDVGVVVYTVIDGRAVGKVVLEDSVRKESFDAVKSLKEMGLKVVMLTGDRREEAEKVARELGIDEFYAELRPQDKVDIIRELKENENTVIMVGDGINDAPALTVADVGVAIGAGTHVAIESADVVLVKNDPRDVVHAISLSNMLRRKMFGNVAWAIVYNVAAMSLASGLFAGYGLVLSPAGGALLMAFSDIIAATISLR